MFFFDTKIQGRAGLFHLNEGHWYNTNEDFIRELEDYLDPLCKTTKLPDYNHNNEGDHNSSVPKRYSQYLCLDRANIAPSGQSQIEPCDLYTIEEDKPLFIHVKRSTKSVSISHLLNQGLNSAETIRAANGSLQRLHQLLKNEGWQELPSWTSEPFKVCFSIITHKDVSKKSENLPFFSRIALRRSLLTLSLMSVDAWYEFIQDIN